MRVRVRARVSLTNSFFLLSLSLCHDTCTNTQEDVGSSEKEFMYKGEEEPEKDTVSEEDILFQVGLFHVPQHHEIYHYPSSAVISTIRLRL